MLKKILSLVLLLLLVNAFPAGANPTTTQRKPTRSRRPAPTPTPAPTPSVNFVAEANLVAEQLRSVSQFIYIYGKIVNGLELSDTQAKEGAASSTAAKNKEIKDKLAVNINSLRGGIDTIATRFRTEPRLQIHYLKLTGASDAIATAAQLATAGRYDDAGKSLVTAVQRLSETIIALR